MDPLSATASVAGILSLIAQSINGIENLRRFVRDVRSAPKILNQFLREIDAFQRTLSQIEKLLSQFPTIQLPEIEDLDLDVLKWQVEKCVLDIEKWVASAAKMDPASSQGIQSFFKKLRVGRNKDGFSEFYKQIATHQQGLGISLLVLGPYLTLYGLDRFDTFTTDVTQKLETHAHHLPTNEQLSETLSGNANQMKSWAVVEMKIPIIEKIEQVETCVRNYTSYSRQGSEDMKSLSDAVSNISSEIFQIKEILSSRKSSKRREVYSCAAMLGIEEAFEEDKCFYCGKKFTHADWRSRGMHLISAHKFGSCDTHVVYDGHDRKDKFRKHLIEYHAQRTMISYERFNSRRPRSKHLDQRSTKVKFAAEPSLLDNPSQSPNCSSEIDSTISEDTSVKDLKKDLDYLNACFRNAEVSNETKCFEDLSYNTLRQFWVIDWKLHCFMERCIINPPGEKFWRRYLPDIPQTPISILEILDRFRTSKDIENKVELFTSLYLTEIHRGTGSFDPCVWADSSHKWADHLHPAVDMSDAFVIGFRDRVSSWLCHFVRNSETVRILASRDSGVVTIERPHILLWLSHFLKQWDVPGNEGTAFEEEAFPLSSDGAIDSRDDLLSEKSRMMREVKHVFEELNLTQYLDRFVEEGFGTWDAICQVTEADFDALGVKRGHRRILQQKISQSKQVSSKCSRASDVDFDSASSRSERSTTDVVRGYSPSPLLKKHTVFALGGSPQSGDDSFNEASSSESWMHSFRQAKKKSNLFIFGGSSGEDESSLGENMHRSSLSELSRHLLNNKKQISFGEEVATRTIHEDRVMDDDIFETDEEDEIDESAIDDDDDSSHWEDSVEDSGKSSIDENTFFQRVNSQPNLTSRQSLIATILYQNDRAATLVNAVPESTTAMQRERTVSLQELSLAGLPNSDDGTLLTMKKSQNPGQEIPRSAAKPIIMTTTNVTPHQAALSPNTTRRYMLQTEINASLRRHLLWERQQKCHTAKAVLKRRHSANDVSNLKQYQEKVHLGTDDKDNYESWNQYFEVRDFYGKGW